MTDPIPQGPGIRSRAHKKSPWMIVLWVVLAVAGISLVLFVGAIVIMASIFKSVLVDSYVSGEKARLSVNELMLSSAPEGWASEQSWGPCVAVNLDCTSLAGEVTLTPVALFGEEMTPMVQCIAIIDYALATGEKVSLSSDTEELPVLGETNKQAMLNECEQQLSSSDSIILRGSLSPEELQVASEENPGLFRPSLPVAYVLSQGSSGEWEIVARWGDL